MYDREVNRLHNVAKARRIQLKVVMALMMVVFLAIAFLMAITVYSADDYWYSVFMDGGLENFLELTRYHYETFNGRVLVHIGAGYSPLRELAVRAHRYCRLLVDTVLSCPFHAAG